MELLIGLIATILGGAWLLNRMSEEPWLFYSVLGIIVLLYLTLGV